ncbi:MAG TPA: bifunctional diaminohydroxyphosphoribosylaminopyrimidine deaminase/5-amino-6-(5-phosphoribosylamino)uracil reductase RibD [Fimbriimonadaceae bacterium]|nr:bifunctional diaminohydroxyphosphoribosylaminopyrimidine deaminase/5-amino-6-(5-phosphoribosylamino)uracil reductase RibD [Fimbriimonadaceae bacterium]
MATDERTMARAIALSRRGYPAPNPHVGCVIARGLRIVGEGFHAYAGGPHAEVEALRAAGSKAKGATCYVTLEPCNHHGRTPPCTDALLAAGVKRVVAAVADPIFSHAGGLARLAAAGVETELGLMADKAREANLPWLTAVERERPYVVVKGAMTLDGRIATPSGDSKWITGERARRQGHRLRAAYGAVLVGRGTVEADDPWLTVRDVRTKSRPVRIVIDPHRRLSEGYRIFDDKAPTIRVVSVDAVEGDVQVDCVDGRIDLEEAMRALYRRGVTSLLVEGGGHTIGSFFDAGLVDRVELFVAGRVFGAGTAWVERAFAGGVADAPRFRIERVKPIGEDVWLTMMPWAESH